MQFFTLNDEDFLCIKELTRKSVGINLTEAKRPLIVSRLSRRLRTLNFGSFSQYCDYVAGNEKELETMVNLLTTNVTKFFREKHHFDFLRDVLFPELLHQADNGEREKKIRIWSAGCSTGEEPYTIAIVLEEFRRNNPDWDYRILASDVNSEVLEEAQNGIYPWEKIKTVAYPQLREFFAMGTGEKQGFFRVKKKIRKKVIFRKINLNLPEEYPRRYDLDAIFCRNVFIYFDRESQNNILKKFAGRLRPFGFLFLGHSETISFPTQKDQKWKSVQHTIFQRIT